MKKYVPKPTSHGDYVANIPIPTFLYEVRVIFTDDMERSKDGRLHVFKQSLSESEGTRALHVSVGDGTSYLFYRLGKRRDGQDWASPGVIAHEAWHAVHHMLYKWAGVKELDGEVIAYHLTYLVDQIHKFKSEVEGAINEPIHTAQGQSD